MKRGWRTSVPNGIARLDEKEGRDQKHGRTRYGQIRLDGADYEGSECGEGDERRWHEELHEVHLG
jgi:hypothetical protein